LQRISPLDSFSRKARGWKEKESHTQERNHNDELHKEPGLGRKRKLPEAGLKHMKILPPSFCKRRD